jgi:site-specific DNA-methyltransferase (adenine-specific)
MSFKQTKSKAPLNRTLTLSPSEIKSLKEKFFIVREKVSPEQIRNKIIHGDIFNTLDLLPLNFVDLLFIDPPYNLYKKFNSGEFREMNDEKYEEWIDSWLLKIIRLLTKNASVYICSDWRSSNAVYNAAKKHFKIQNRITWEREKGRGSKINWKNCIEDIWFCTLSNNYTFNLNDVKIKRKVIAPYKTKDGKPKDWEENEKDNFRITHPSNIWTDITVPFWSMPENTEHPAQKPEKLLAKIILASSNKGDFVFDPFAGSGTTLVTAKKLGRNFAGIEIDEYYCCLAEKRIELAEKDNSIQGYNDGIFWERNTLQIQTKSSKTKHDENQTGLF